jgi:hypothetical protein
MLKIIEAFSIAATGWPLVHAAVAKRPNMVNLTTGIRTSSRQWRYRCRAGGGAQLDDEGAPCGGRAQAVARLDGQAKRSTRTLTGFFRAVSRCSPGPGRPAAGASSAGVTDAQPRPPDGERHRPLGAEHRLQPGGLRADQRRRRRDSTVTRTSTSAGSRPAPANARCPARAASSTASSASSARPIRTRRCRRPVQHHDLRFGQRPQPRHRGRCRRQVAAGSRTHRCGHRPYLVGGRRQAVLDTRARFDPASKA